MSISRQTEEGNRRGIISAMRRQKSRNPIRKMNTKEYKHIQDTKKGTHQTMLRKTNN